MPARKDKAEASNIITPAIVPIQLSIKSDKEEVLDGK